MNNGIKIGRRRRSSSLLYQEPPESLDHMSDQSVVPNLNAQWVNAKGTLKASLLCRMVRKRKPPRGLRAL